MNFSPLGQSLLRAVRDSRVISNTQPNIVDLIVYNQIEFDKIFRKPKKFGCCQTLDQNETQVYFNVDSFLFSFDLVWFGNMLNACPQIQLAYFMSKVKSYHVIVIVMES